MPYGVGYPLGQLGSAVLAGTPLSGEALQAAEEPSLCASSDNISVSSTPCSAPKHKHSPMPVTGEKINPTPATACCKVLCFGNLLVLSC